MWKATQLEDLLMRLLKRVAKATHIVATQESKPRDQPTTTPRTQDGSQQWAHSKPGRRPCKAREYKSSRQTRRSVPVYTVGFANYQLCDGVAQSTSEVNGAGSKINLAQTQWAGEVYQHMNLKPNTPGGAPPKQRPEQGAHARPGQLGRKRTRRPYHTSA